MTYKELLNKLISESGLSNKEIVSRCKEMGESITPNYLSVLKNQKGKIASDNLSLILAKACNAEHDEILLVQAYLDKAPEIIVDYFNKLFNQSIQVSYTLLQMSEENIPAQLRKTYIDDEKKKIDNLFLSEFICKTRQEEYTLDLESILKQSKEKKPLKWALIPISDEEDIKVLSNDEITNI